MEAEEQNGPTHADTTDGGGLWRWQCVWRDGEVSARAGRPEKASLQEGQRPEDKEERGEAQACSTLGKGPTGARGSRTSPKHWREQGPDG